MIDTTQKNQNDLSNSEETENEKSEEFKNFENALKDIFSLSPEKAKEIRESKPKRKPEECQGN